MANNLYKRGRIFYYDFTFEGKRYNGSTGCENKKQAELILYKMRADVIEGKIRPGKKKKILFIELSKRFADWSRDHRKGTHVRDLQHLKHLNAFFGNMSIGDISPEEIERYMGQRKKAVSGSTVNREVQLMRAMFNKAIAWRLIETNFASAKFISFFPEPPKTHRWVEPEEVNALLEECTGKLKHLYGVIFVAVHTGMRKSELFKLKWENVDLEHGTLTVKHAKHHQNRYIELNDDVVSVLKYEIPKYGEFVFSHPDGRPMTRVDKSLATAVERAGIKRCTLHDFRATWATELLAAGIELETVRRLGGWRDYTTILRYVEVVKGRTRDASNSLVGKYKSRHFSRQLKDSAKPHNVISIKSTAPVAQVDRAAVS